MKVRQERIEAIRVKKKSSPCPECLRTAARGMVETEMGLLVEQRQGLCYTWMVTDLSTDRTRCTAQCAKCGCKAIFGGSDEVYKAAIEREFETYRHDGKRWTRSKVE